MGQYYSQFHHDYNLLLTGLFWRIMDVVPLSALGELG